MSESSTTVRGSGKAAATSRNGAVDGKKPSIHTLGELRSSGWQSVSVKEEMRRNLIRKLKGGQTLFEGILGYEKSVLPQIRNAILAKHDMILLGLRGQAKTRMLRALTGLLDEYIPIVQGSEINDDPFHPLSRFAKERIAREGEDTPIDWLYRSERYGEKLATPDTTVADLIGDLDPIKAATRKLTLADEQVINFGLIPRSNRGIFVINELPDLQPRIQVALLNIMQERDIQIRGFNVRIPLDISIAFSANPEDYTNRGNIITPLKDRIDAQIITHYPKEIDIAKTITRQEAWAEREEGPVVHVPEVYREMVEWVAFEARESEYVDQKSGVSTRMTITAMEQMISAAEQRAILNGEQETCVRVTDLYHIVPALTGKLELVYEGEQEGAISVAKLLIGKAVNKAFKQVFPDPQQRSKTKAGRSSAGRRAAESASSESLKETPSQKTPYSDILGWFTAGGMVELAHTASDARYRSELSKVDGLEDLTRTTLASSKLELARLEHPEDLFSWMDLVLEALHQNSLVGKEDLDTGPAYTDLVGSVLGDLGSLMGGYDEEDEEDVDQG